MENNKTISVLGCGWLGQPLAGRLLELGYAVKGSTTTPEKLPALQKRGIQPYLLRFGESNDLAQLQHFLDSDLLILNLPPGRKNFQPGSYLQKMQALAAAFRPNRPEKLIFVGSTSSMEAKPGSPGHELEQAEKYFQAREGLKTAVIRFGGLVGPGRNPVRFLAGRTDMPGGNTPVNLIHQADCIGLILSIMGPDFRPGNYVGVAEEHPSRAEYYGFEARRRGLEAPGFTDEPRKGAKWVDGTGTAKSLGYNYLYPDPMGFPME